MASESMTYSDLYGPLSEIRTKQQADEYFEFLVSWRTKEFSMPRDEAERIERNNVGYWTGYLDEATARRVMELFQVEHPFFGTEFPSLDEAFEIGVRAGTAARQKFGG